MNDFVQPVLSFLSEDNLGVLLPVGLATLFGTNPVPLFAAWTTAVPGFLLVAVLCWIALRFGIAVRTWRGRRLMLGRWRRLTRWEFWPVWAVYPPVVLYIGWLSLRYRRLTLPTAVNPGIGGGGGLVGASKSEILRGLAPAGDAIARWALIGSGTLDQRRDSVRTFMTREQLTFPLVLKPDAGQRGAGVVIVRNEDVLVQTLRDTAVPLVAQEYVPGVEFGVFYFRRPDAPSGEIFAITDKRMVVVTGDGRRTLEELILGDDRAVCMAPFFLRKFSGRLADVPAPGETVVLSELGTHCLGALFLDGTHLGTPALAAEIDRVSRGFDGFYFGRYDVRTASAAAFQRGVFKVIELNGLTSEATSIYDPRHSVWFGWRMLCRQWRIAFSIAAENQARGARPLTWRETCRVIFPVSKPS